MFSFLFPKTAIQPPVQVDGVSIRICSCTSSFGSSSSYLLSGELEIKCLPNNYEIVCSLIGKQLSSRHSPMTLAESEVVILSVDPSETASYHFFCLLPPNLPPSYKSKHTRIVYMVKVVVMRKEDKQLVGSHSIPFHMPVSGTHSPVSVATESTNTEVKPIVACRLDLAILSSSEEATPGALVSRLLESKDQIVSPLLSEIKTISKDTLYNIKSPQGHVVSLHVFEYCLGVPLRGTLEFKVVNCRAVCLELVRHEKFMVETEWSGASTVLWKQSICAEGLDRMTFSCPLDASWTGDFVTDRVALSSALHFRFVLPNAEDLHWTLPLHILDPASVTSHERLKDI